MNQKAKPVKPLIINKTLEDKTIIDEEWKPEGEREVIVLVSDANLDNFIIKYNMQISREINCRLETRVLVLSYRVKDIDINCISLINWQDCVYGNFDILATYSDCDTMYDQLHLFDAEENEYHIDWNDFFAKKESMS